MKLRGGAENDGGVVTLNEKGPNTSLFSVLWLANERRIQPGEAISTISAIGTTTDPAPSKLEAVAGVVADRMLEVGLHEDHEAVDIALAVARLVVRNLDGSVVFDKPGYTEIDRDTLVAAWRRLNNESNPNIRMRRGLELGDRAVHFGAGIGSRHLSRVMNGREAHRYTQSLALGGYRAALDAADRVSSKTAAEIKMVVPTLVSRVDEVTKLLRLLVESRTDRISRLGLN